jgi:hypothetical protein
MAAFLAHLNLNGSWNVTVAPGIAIRYDVGGGVGFVIPMIAFLAARACDYGLACNRIDVNGGSRLLTGYRPANHGGHGCSACSPEEPAASQATTFREVTLNFLI